MTGVEKCLTNKNKGATLPLKKYYQGIIRRIDSFSMWVLLFHALSGSTGGPAAFPASRA
jgi:hypothetical protein